jgi:hypothetical protein
LLRTVATEGVVTQPGLHSKVLEMLSHILTRNVTNVKVKTDEALRPPA